MDIVENTLIIVAIEFLLCCVWFSSNTKGNDGWTPVASGRRCCVHAFDDAVIVWHVRWRMLRYLRAVVSTRVRIQLAWYLSLSRSVAHYLFGRKRHLKNKVDFVHSTGCCG